MTLNGLIFVDQLHFMLIKGYGPRICLDSLQRLSVFTQWECACPRRHWQHLLKILIEIIIGISLIFLFQCDWKHSESWLCVSQQPMPISSLLRALALVSFYSVYLWARVMPATCQLTDNLVTFVASQHPTWLLNFLPAVSVLVLVPLLSP